MTWTERPFLKDFKSRISWRFPGESFHGEGRANLISGPLPACAALFSPTLPSSDCRETSRDPFQGWRIVTSLGKEVGADASLG